MNTSSKSIRKLALLLVLAMMFTAFPLFEADIAYAAAGSATISSGSDLTAEAGASVTVPVNISGNPGTAGLGLIVTYDKDVLTPVAAEATSLTADGTYNDSIETSTNNSFRIVWAASDNITADGTLFNIRFNVSEYAEGETTVEFSYVQDDTFNEDFEDIRLNCSPARINVTPKSSSVTTIRSSANQSVNAGEEIAVPILIDNVDKISALSFSLKYDASVFDMSASENGIGNCTVSGDAGDITCTVTGIDTSVSSGTIVTLRFRVTEFVSGNYVFNLSSDSVSAEDFRVKVINTHADENAVVYGKNIALDGNELAVDVGIRNNHGLAAFRFTITYDASVLTPVSAAKNSMLPGSFDTTIGSKEGSFDLLWFSADNFTQNDTIFTVCFTVKDGASASTILGMDYSQGDTCDEDTNDVILTMEDIEVKLSEEVVSLESISAQKTRTEYTTGDVLNTDDIKVTATYSDGTSKEVTGFTTNADSIDMMTAGSKTLTVTYTEDSITVSMDIAINVSEAAKLEPVSLSAEKVKTYYVVGETLNTDDLTVSVQYNTGATKEVTDYTTDADNFDMSTAHTDFLTVSYTEGGKTVSAVIIIFVLSYDQYAAKEVRETISAMDPTDEESVQEARAAYDALTDEQKALIDPEVLKKLEDAEAAIAQHETDQQAADNVTAAINSLDPSDEESVQAARAAYDALTDAQKALIDPEVLKKLEDAEAGFEIIPIDMEAYADLVKLSSASFTYNGKVITPTLTFVEDEANPFPVPLPTKDDYTLTCSTDRKSVGNHKVTFTFKGNYKGRLSYTFKINPKGVSITKLTKAKKGFTVKWKKQSSKMSKSRITGYQIRYSLKSNMKSSKTKTVKGYKKTLKKITKLKAKKKYYVQIRTYMKVSGKTYYSSWSKSQKIKTK